MFLEIPGLARNFGGERSWNCSFKSSSCPGEQPHQAVTEVYKLLAPPCFQFWLTPPLQNESLKILSQPQYLQQSITWLHFTEAFFFFPPKSSCRVGFWFAIKSQEFGAFLLKLTCTSILLGALRVQQYPSGQIMQAPSAAVLGLGFHGAQAGACLWGS